MPSQEFEDRIQRIKAKSKSPAPVLQPAPPNQPESEPQIVENSGGTSFLFRFLSGLLIIPLAMMARVLTEIALEPGFTSESAVHYIPVMAIVAGYHLLMLVGVAIAIFTFRRRPRTAWVVLMSAMGYGIGSVLMTLIDK